MTIFPAIDIRAGKCVRLRQGDFHQETVYGDNPAQMAMEFEREGAKALHLVDLDGAKSGQPVNLAAIQSITQVVKIPCQLGGGLRTLEDIELVLKIGIVRAILGSQACREPDWLSEMARRYPERLLLGIDARDGLVATEGWQEVSQLSALELAARVSHLPLAGIIYTDIAHDGMMAGPSWEGLAAMTRVARLPIVASGGVTTLDDIRRLGQMRVSGCIIGRALYEGTIRLAEALQVAGDLEC